MATITLTLSNTCAGGGHLHFAITGDRAKNLTLDITELTSPIEEQDLDIFCKVLTRLVRIGRTNAEARTVLQGGVTVTV